MKLEEDQSTFKIEVKQWLKSHKFDYKWIADQCGVSEITVRNWMSQKTIPPLKQQLIERVMVQMPTSYQGVPKTYTTDVQVDASLSLTVKLSPDLYKQLESKASQQGISLGDMVAQAISRLVRTEPTPLPLQTRKVILPSQS
ncbi:MAG: hypothetical protein RR719_09580 [Akkermansia sp.]